jgi:type I restriction enzyme, R subunit
MTTKEAQARLKINKLLEEADWRLLDCEQGKSNVSLEHRTKKAKYDNQALGIDLENAPDGFIDYLLLNEDKKPIGIVEAKRESIDPLNAKEQTREYARAQHVRHIFLSNGNVHYYWDLEQGEPTVISKFLSSAQIGEAIKWVPDPPKMQEQNVNENYIADSQDSKWFTYSPEQKQAEMKDKGIRLLREYQVEAANKLKDEYVGGKRRFLFEMATGTGKTLLSAAIIKMFIRSKNAVRVLFLVDRIELENQAFRNFKAYLENDGILPVIYKRNKSDWQNAQIVITTIQSLSYDNRFLREFSPSDFQLVISDEAHRTIGGNNRIIFDYFIGTKLGLTATPKDYLKGIDIKETDPREVERRMLLDTYRTFGCENGFPTYRFSLEDAVKHVPPYLCSPKLLDARTNITTELLSEDGWTVKFQNEDGDEEEDTFYKRDFMKKVFSRQTNETFVRAFLQKAKRDPITNEIGKTIFFCISRLHCTLMTKMLNDEAGKMYPEQYGKGSFFAVQITSDIPGSQDRTIQFSNNCLNGHSYFNSSIRDYETSKSRVCVTVGMMTTGYDCQDIMNVVLARPIFSLTDYIQIKGRGTRLFTFEYRNGQRTVIKKDNYFLFDFFANHQYFQDEFDYKEKIDLPPIGSGEGEGGGGGNKIIYNYTGADDIKAVKEEQFGPDRIMRVDREAFSKKFEEAAKEEITKHTELQKAVEQEDWNTLSAYVKENVFDKPEEYWNLDKLNDVYNLDRRITLKEVLMKVLLPEYKIKDRTELADEEFQKFVSDKIVDGSKYSPAKKLFEAYLLFEDFRKKINDRKPDVNDMRFNINDLKLLGTDWQLIVSYIKENVNLNTYLPR